jgi:hypothetical protein
MLLLQTIGVVEVKLFSPDGSMVYSGGLEWNNKIIDIIGKNKNIIIIAIIILGV